mgnify:CR=1 FL=1
MKGEEKRDKRERKYHCDLCNFHSNDKAKIGIHFSTLKQTKRAKGEKEDEKGKKREQEHNVSLIQTPWIFNHWSIHCTKTNNNFKTIL